MISKDMSIFELLQKYPEAKKILKEHGMSCLGCMGAEQETIEAGARMHGIDLSTLLKELRSQDVK